MIIPFPIKKELPKNGLDLIETESRLMRLLLDRLLKSQPDVFIFESAFSDVARMMSDVKSGKPYRPPFESSIMLVRSMCCEDGDLVRCGRRLLDFYGMVHHVSDLSKRPLPVVKLVQIATIALGVENGLTFTRIIEESGEPTEVMLITSEAAFEAKYSASVRVIVHAPLSTKRGRKRHLSSAR